MADPVWEPRSPAAQPGRASPWPFAGMAGMAATFFLYAASGLLAPVWAVVVLLLVWLALFVTACRWWTPRPKLVPVLPVVSLVVWFAAIMAGGVWLDWTA